MINKEISEEEYLNKTLWRARLSNGEIAIQNDDNCSSWLMLKDYVKQNNLKIEKVFVAFRDHSIHDFMPANAEGYFFVRSVLGILDCPVTFHYYVFGYLKGKYVHCVKYKIPELIQVEQDVRLREDCEDCLIINPD